MQDIELLEEFEEERQILDNIKTKNRKKYNKNRIAKNKEKKKAILSGGGRSRKTLNYYKRPEKYIEYISLKPAYIYCDEEEKYTSLGYYDRAGLKEVRNVYPMNDLRMRQIDPDTFYCVYILKRVKKIYIYNEDKTKILRTFSYEDDKFFLPPYKYQEINDFILYKLEKEFGEEIIDLMYCQGEYRYTEKYVNEHKYNKYKKFKKESNFFKKQEPLGNMRARNKQILRNLKKFEVDSDEYNDLLCKLVDKFNDTDYKNW